MPAQQKRASLQLPDHAHSLVRVAINSAVQTTRLYRYLLRYEIDHAKQTLQATHIDGATLCKVLTSDDQWHKPTMQTTQNKQNFLFWADATGDVCCWS